jgi:hypothetical protein
MKWAETEMGSGDFARMKAGRAAMERLEAELRRQVEADDAKRAMAEVQTIARSRGERIVEESHAALVTITEGVIPVQRWQTTTRLRNTARDGLDSLRLAPTHYDAGLRYRELWDRARAELGSAMADPGRARATPGSRIPPRLDEKLTARAHLNRIEARVLEQDRSGEARQVLRDVAGEGKCIANLCTSGGGRKRKTDRLLAALDVVADFFGMQ